MSIADKKSFRTSSEELNISSDFLEENKKNLQSMGKKRGGPYTKQETIKRKNEVFRLHFEYGYSANKISQLMNINRNTINSDIQFWYSESFKNLNFADPGTTIVTQIMKLEAQKTRLREQLDKTETLSERISIEKLIFDIDSKIIHVYLQMKNSESNIHKVATKWINDLMKQFKREERFISYYDTMRVSKKAQERIKKIIKDDKKILRS